MRGEKGKTARTVKLTDAEALNLLAGASMGRLVFSGQTRTVILPVHHVIDDAQVLIPAHEAWEILSAARGAATVTFEAEHQMQDGTSWSVIVIGTASLVRDPAEISRYRTMATPHTSAAMGYLVRINPQIISGYRLDQPV